MSINKFEFEVTTEITKEIAKRYTFYVLFNGSRVLKYSLILLFYAFIYVVSGFDIAFALIQAFFLSIFAYIIQGNVIKNLTISLEAFGYTNGATTTIQISKKSVIIENQIVTYRLLPKHIYKVIKVDKYIFLQLTKSRQATMLALPDTKDLYKKICDFKKQEKS